MAKKKRKQTTRQASRQNPTAPSDPISPDFIAFKQDLLNPRNKERFFKQLRNCDLNSLTHSFQEAFSVDVANLSLPDGISTIGGYEKVADDRYWVSDEFNHRIVEVNAEFETIRTFGQYGSGSEDFWYPRKILKLRNGTIAIVDSWNHRIKIHDVSGQFIRSLGTYGDKEGCLFEPSAIAEDDEGNLYVADRCNHRIFLFRQDGTFGYFGKRGSIRGNSRLGANYLFQDHKVYLEFPTDIVSSGNRLFIADSGNNRVVVCNPDGEELYSIRGLSHPTSILVMGTNLIVADMNGRKVSAFKTNGGYLASLVFKSRDEEEKLYPLNLFQQETSIILSFSNAREIVSFPFHEGNCDQMCRLENELQENANAILGILSQQTANRNWEEAIESLELISAEFSDTFQDKDLLLGLCHECRHNAYEADKSVQTKLFNLLNEILTKVLEAQFGLLKESIAKKEELALALWKGKCSDEAKVLLETSPSTEKTGETLMLEQNHERSCEASFELVMGIRSIFRLSSLLLDETRSLSFPAPMGLILRQLELLLETQLSFLLGKETAILRAKESMGKIPLENQLNWEPFFTESRAIQERSRMNEFMARIFQSFHSSVITCLKDAKTEAMQTDVILDRTKSIRDKLLDIAFLTELEWDNVEIVATNSLGAVEGLLRSFQRNFSPIHGISLEENERVGGMLNCIRQGIGFPIRVSVIYKLHEQLIVHGGIRSEDLEPILESGHDCGTKPLAEFFHLLMTQLRHEEKALNDLVGENERQFLLGFENDNQQEFFKSDVKKRILLQREMHSLNISRSILSHDIGVLLMQYREDFLLLCLIGNLLSERFGQEGNTENRLDILVTLLSLQKHFREELVQATDSYLAEGRIMTELETSINGRFRTDEKLPQVISEQKKNLFLSSKRQFWFRTKRHHFNLLKILAEEFCTTLLALHGNAITDENAIVELTKNPSFASKGNRWVSETIKQRSNVFPLLNGHDFHFNSCIRFSEAITNSSHATNGIADVAGMRLFGGEFLVCNSSQNRIDVYNLDGDFMKTAFHSGNGKEEVVSPVDIERNLQGEYLVLDSARTRIRLFNREFKFIKTITDGASALKLSGASKIAKGTGTSLFICDISGNRIVEISHEGDFMREITETNGNALQHPIDLLFLRNGSILLVESTPPPECHCKLTLLNQSWEIRKEVFGKDIGISSFRPGAQDSEGRLWFSDAIGHSVNIFDEGLNLLSRFGELGSGEREFFSPGRIVSYNGGILVNDAGNRRIVRLKMTQS